MRKVDVLVVGGGPAGLAAAAAAAPSSEVLLVHKDREIGRPVRTSGGTWQSEIDELGIPSDYYKVIEELTFASPNKRLDVRFRADWPAVLDVTRTYRHLAQTAERAGAVISCGTQFIEVAETSAGEIVCHQFDGRRLEAVTARFVVDASGSQRSVLHSLRLAQRPTRFGTGTEYEFEDRSEDRRRAALFVGSCFAPAGYGWIFPTPSGTLRVGIGVIRPESGQSPKMLLERFLASSQSKELGVSVGRLREKHSGIIPADGPCQRLVHGRVVAVGDAAGQALPLVGEGIRYSIESGRRAGQAIAAALSAPASTEESLAEYANWWDSKYRRQFQLAQRINRRISRLGDEDWDNAISALRLLDGDSLAHLLKMQIDLRLLFMLALGDPVRGLRLAMRHFFS